MPPEKKPVLLIADDDPEILTMLSVRLNKKGYEVIEAVDGLQTLRYARERRPDLRIGHFSHTPWAPPDYFRLLPDDVARRLLRGVLGADRAAFLTHRWADAFAACCADLPGAEAGARTAASSPSPAARCRTAPASHRPSRRNGRWPACCCRRSTAASAPSVNR